MGHGVSLLPNVEERGRVACVHAAIYEQTRAHAGRHEGPSVVIRDGQSVKTKERGGVRGFDAHKRVKGRKGIVRLSGCDLTDPESIAERVLSTC